MELDFQVQISVRSAVAARQPLPCQTDLLAFGDAFGDFDVEGFALISHTAIFVQSRHIQSQTAFRTGIGCVNINAQFGVLVFSLDRAARPLGSGAGVAER